MKAILFTFAVFFMTHSAFSQQLDSNLMVLNTEELPSITTKPSPKPLNGDYLDSVLDHSMATHVSTLEEQVSKFDITMLPEYNGGSEPFKTIFKTNKGSIEVVYNSNGKILKTKEMYKNVKLPDAVRDRIFKKHSGWILLNVDYHVNYQNNKKIEKSYYISIGKNKQKKSFKMNSNGDMI